MVERQEPVRILRERLAAALQGQGGLVTVAGPAGSGRTTLLADLCSTAAQSGATVLYAASSTSERDLPLGVLGQLLSEAALAAPGTEQAARRWSTGRDGGGPAALQRSSADDLCALLLDLATRTPLLICVDDARQTDDASLLCLATLAQRIGGSRVLLVVADLPDDSSSHPATPLRRAGGRHIELEVLSRFGVSEIVARRTGRSDDALSARCHAISGGNPALVHALLDDWEAPTAGDTETASRAALGYGDFFRQAVRSCLGRYDDGVVGVARAAAVLGDSSSAELVTALLGLNPTRVGQLLGQLNRTGLARQDKPCHTAVRDAILDDAAPAEIGWFNRQTARLLHARGATAERVARHLLAADDPGHDWMIDTLCQAADEAVSDDAGFAHRCLELARKHGADCRRLADVLVRLTGVEWQLPSFSMARSSANVRGALAEIRAGGEHTPALLRYLLRQGSFADVAEAVTVVGENADVIRPADLQELRLLVSVSYPTLVDHLGYPDQIGPNEERTGAAILHRVLTQQADEHDLAAADRILLAAQPTSDSFDQVESALLALIYADELGRAAAACEVVMDRAARVGSAAWRARLAALHAETTLRKGDLAATTAQAQLALAHLPEEAWGVAVGGPLSCLLLTATMDGDLAAAVEYAALPVPDDIFRTRFGLHYLYARGEYHLATNRSQAALADFLTCGELMRGWGIDSPSLVPWRTAAARANLRLGKSEQARWLVEEQSSRTGWPVSRSRGTPLRHRAAVADTDTRYRSALLHQAFDELIDGRDRAESGRALAGLGHAYQTLGEHRRARTMPRRADRLTEAQRVTPMLARLAATSAESGSAGGDADGAYLGDTPVLSDAERRVATLAAAGLTNREIAVKLYITMSTVEQHLTRVYRKLKLTGRDALPVGLDRLTAIA
ncbi:helix-turn-helix transcriptional regulator [Micromonospora parathelypteridis]|uniref:DNA-binding CsgD family transcriptional regulator n=1 Tax=Micromonospora parathelypteridis TaxID=1839617 RepID=A0A840VYP3_9ACTN|nr:LuxR family transcriptional regulator [Micromonospora parathelypteridis]MBB5476111.1 DNA-binding CsgD family transcriptional regulator [Micromonospora parathelypteridis]